MAKLLGVNVIDMQDGEITKVSYQGEEYTKVDGAPKTGDVMYETSGGPDVTIGAYYEVTALDSDDDPRFVDDVGAFNGVFLKKTHVTPNVYFRKSPAAVSSAPFAEMITSKVIAVEERVSALEGAKLGIDTGYVFTTKPEFNEGDRVKTLTNGEFYDIEAGEFVEITDITGMQPYNIRVETGDGEVFDYFRPQDLVLATEEEPKPVVGDIVVVTGNTNGSRNEVGDIGKLDGVCVDVPGRPETDCSNGNITEFTEMRIATPAEIEDYEFHVIAVEAQAAKVAIFTKAGRKPNEYRKGDVVRVTRELGESITPVLGVIEDDYNPNYGVRISDDYLVVFLGDTEGEDGEMEIVCFAEDRKDSVTKGGR